MNEKENLIATYLANRDGPPERAEPGHFYITDLLAFAEGTALPELATTIEAHCVSCEPCRSRVESSRIILGRDEDLSELPLAGSLLEFVVTPPEPRPEPPGKLKGELDREQDHTPEQPQSLASDTSLSHSGNTRISCTGLATARDLRKALSDKPDVRDEEPATLDPVATWVLGDQTAKRPKPGPASTPDFDEMNMMEVAAGTTPQVQREHLPTEDSSRIPSSAAELDSLPEELPDAGSPVATAALLPPTCKDDILQPRKQDEDLPKPLEGSLRKLAASPPESTVTGSTSVAHAPNAKEALPGEIRPWLPFILSEANLRQELVEDFLAFITKRVPLGPDERLGLKLPGWLTEFVAERPKDCGAFRPICSPDMPKIIAHAAARRAAEEYQPKSGGIAHRILKCVKSAPVSDPREYSEFPLPDDLQDDLFARSVLEDLGDKGNLLKISADLLFQMVA